MTAAQARAELSLRVGADAVPLLSDADLDAILANHTRYTTYAAETAYTVGSKVLPGYGRVYRCIVAGTSATAALVPEWPTQKAGFTGQQIGDGTGDLLWEDDGPDHIGNYDLSGAERDAWLLKASRVQAYVDTSDPNGSIKASQEAQSYERRANRLSGVWVG